MGLEEKIALLEQSQKELESVLSSDYEQWSSIVDKKLKLEREIKEAKEQMLIDGGVEMQSNELKNYFCKCLSEKRVTDELWTVKINGILFKSDKGKYTWTSENRAFRAICNYVYEWGEDPLRSLVRTDRIDIAEVVESLIESGDIKIERIL